MSIAMSFGISVAETLRALRRLNQIMAAYHSPTARHYHGLVLARRETARLVAARRSAA